MNTRTAALAALLAFTFAACESRFLTAYNEAKIEFGARNYEETVRILGPAVDAWKESDGAGARADAYQMIGIAYHEMRKTDQAIAHFSKAVALSTAAYESAYRLGVIHLTSNQPAEAIEAFRAALERRKDDPLSVLGLGNAFYADGRTVEARAQYERLLDVSPGVRDAIASIKGLDNQRPPARKVKPAARPAAKSVKKPAPAKATAKTAKTAKPAKASKTTKRR